MLSKGRYIEYSWVFITVFCVSTVSKSNYIEYSRVHTIVFMCLHGLRRQGYSIYLRFPQYTYGCHFCVSTSVLITVFMASQCPQKASILNIAGFSSLFLWRLNRLKKQVYILNIATFSPSLSCIYVVSEGRNILYT